MNCGFPLGLTTNVLHTKLMVVFAFKCSLSCIKLKVPFQIHRSHFQNGDMTWQCAWIWPNGDTRNSYFHKKKMLHFMKNTREMYHFHFQYKTFTLICPSDSTDQTRELGPDPLHSGTPWWLPQTIRQGLVQANESVCNYIKNLPQTFCSTLR